MTKKNPPLTLDDLDDLLNFGRYPHEVMVQQAYEDMGKPTYGDGSSPKQNIVENAMAMLQFPEFKMFSKKDYVRFVWNEGHKNEDLLSIHPRKGIDRGMKKIIKTHGEVLRNPIVPRNYLKAMDEGWTGFPTWSISPTISAHDLSGNPPIGLIGVKGQANPPGVPKEASELSKERKKEIRKKWLELVNMTATELQTFYDSDLGNKKAGLSREEAKEAGISSGRDSALAIIKMKQTPVKEWHKRHSKDRGRDIMLDFWQWAQKQINFNTRHRAMRGPYLDEKGRPTRKLLGLWIWGHDPWRYAIKVKSERLPKCPDVPWIGSAEKKKFGVLPKMNPQFKVLTGNIVTISGPSSSGKSTISKALSEKMRASMVPSYMTREPRPNEQQGVDGFFVSVERFEDMINNGDFTTKEGVNLWVKQKNGEYYGRRVSDFMGSKPVVVDVNFEGLRKMRKAFPGRTYSVFIRTRQGPKRRRENLEKRGVHTEEEIEARVRAGTAMLQTFGDMNFDFISSNKFGEVEKNVAMIASEFKKWEKAPQTNPRFSKPSKRCSTKKPCGGKVIYKSMAAANKAINSGVAGGHTAYHSPQCQDDRNRRVYHTRTTSYMFNPPAIRMGQELLHKPSGEKLKYIEAEIDEEGKTWYIVEDMAGERTRLEDTELEFYSLWPKSSLWQTNPPVGDFEGAMDMGIQKDGPSRYHGHYPSGRESSVPDKASKWKKKSFRVEMPLNSKAEADGTYTMGFLEKHEDDDRPYIVSIKYDGDNNILHFDGEETVIFTRRGRWRKDFHLTDQITASLKKNGVSSAIILGELYVVDQDGKTVPLSQQSSFTQAPKNLNMQESMRFAAFDILEINGKNIEDTPYAARMDILKPLIHGDAVKVVEHWRSKGGMNEVMEAWNEGISNDPNFEGLIVRFEGDNKSIKVKMHGTADLVVLGFYYGEEGGRDEAIVGGGALAWMDEDGDFVLAGNSVLGSSIVEKAELLQRLLPTAVDAPRVKWGDHIVDRSITHDHRGRGAITPVEPHLIGEFKYRSLNYSERPVYRFEDGHYFRVGTKRAPVLFQCTFGRWRPDKSLTHQDLRMTQVAGEGEGKWKKNPHKQDGPYAWWEPDPRGHQIYNNSSSLQYINNQLVGDQNISRRDVFNTVAKGVESKYGVKYQIVSPEEAEQIDYLKDMDAFFDGRNYGTWDEENGVVYFNEEMFNDRKTALRELGHETGAVIIASMYGGKYNIPRADYHGMNSVRPLTHLVDSYTFGWYEPKPGQSKAIVRSNPPEDDDTNYPGGTAQFLLDGILLGSLKSKMNDWRTEGVSKTVTLKDWPIHYPELAARLEEAEKLGWSVPSIPKVKVNPPWEEDEDEEPPTPKEYSVPNEKGVVAQHIETQDEAESIVLRWTNETDEDFVAFEMIYAMPDGSRRWAVVRKPEGGKSGSPLVSPMRSSPHYLESANKYGLGPDCPRCGSNYTEKVGKFRVAVQDGPAHVMEGGYHCNYCGFNWDTESIDLVRLNPPATELQWEHRTEINQFSNVLHTLFGRDSYGAGVAIRFHIVEGRARIDSIGLRDPITMAIDSGLWEGKQLTKEQISALENDDFQIVGPFALKFSEVQNKWMDSADEIKGKGYGQAAYLKLLDYADEVYSRARSKKATRAWEALEKRQDELGIVVERHRGVGRQGGDAFLMMRAKQNPPKKTPGGKTIPKRYLKGLTKEEMQIAIKEIDKGYDYDIDDPEAYEYWKSDIKATARGYKTVPSKYKKKFIEMYGPLPEKGKFLDKMAKATGIKKSILQKVYDKGLAAWRTGHRPGVKQHQWAAGRVYSFVTLGNTVKKGKKKMGDFQLAIEAGLIKENGVLPSKKGGIFPRAGYIYDPPENEEYALHVEVQKNMRKYNKLVKDWMNKNHNASWSWRGDFKTEAEKKKFKQAKAYAKENIDGPIVCSEECIACFYKQGGMTEAEIRERAKGVKENPPPPKQAVEIPTVIVWPPDPGWSDKIVRSSAKGLRTLGESQRKHMEGTAEIGFFLFGDNEARQGKGGQAKELRGLANAYGIRTKKRPSLDDSAFWSDETYKTNIKMMSEDFLEVFMGTQRLSKLNPVLYIPRDGIGTGMAQLKSRAPKTYKWLKTFLDNLIRTGDEQDVKDNIKKWRMK